jgi:hypothetical protein
MLFVCKRSQAGNVGRHLDLDACHGRAVERALVRRVEPHGTEQRGARCESASRIR